MDGARAHVVRLGRGQQSVVGMGGGSFWGAVLWPAEDAEADDGAAVPRATRPVDTRKDDQADNGLRWSVCSVHLAPLRPGGSADADEATGVPLAAATGACIRACKDASVPEARRDGAEASQCLRRWPASIATEPCETDCIRAAPELWPSVVAVPRWSASLTARWLGPSADDMHCRAPSPLLP